MFQIQIILIQIFQFHLFQIYSIGTLVCTSSISVTQSTDFAKINDSNSEMTSRGPLFLVLVQSISLRVTRTPHLLVEHEQEVVYIKSHIHERETIFGFNKPH